MPLPLRLAATACALACLLRAGGPAAWESNSWSDFLKGRFSGVSLTRDGRLALAPRVDTLSTTGESAVWAVVRASDGALWFATGHRGRLYRLTPGASTAAQPPALWTAQQPEIFALAPAPAGAVFAATSPGGQIWRIDPSGKAEEWFSTKAKYVWSLAVAHDGAVFAATGDDGRVWRITARGQGAVWYETGQAHVTCLAFDNSGALLAGSEPNGNLYRITAQNRASVLLHSTLPEIRDVLALPDGSLLAAALGGGLAQKQSQAAAAAAASMANIPTMTTTITVTADPSSHSVPSAPTQTGLDLKPPAARSAAPPADASATPPATAPVEVAGVEKSALYRIAPDLTVETIWTSKEENLLGLAVSAGTPFVSTDLRGRVYSVAPNARTALVVETGEGEATRLLDTPAGLLVATGTLAKLFILNATIEYSGWYESSVFDAGAVARWGRLEWRGDLAGARILFRTRSGNSARPDKTWSDWSEPLTDPASARLTSPNARYVQWKLELQGSAPSAGAPSATASAASIDAVSLSYQPQNNRPVVRSITVTPQWVAAPQKSSAASTQSGAGSAFSVTVTDSGDSGPAITSGTPTQQINRGGVLQLFLSWQADDPDNDRLVYTLQVRGEGEREWKTLKSELTDNTFSLDADSLADGRYRFRVTASDRPSNPPSQAREAELESAPVLLDQTPPQVTLAEPRRGPQGILNIEVEAVDALSPVRRAEVSIDAGPWRPMECADGVADSLRERFLVSLQALTAGEHLVTVRVYDASGNAGLARRVIH